MERTINIIGAGLAGLSAAITLAREGIPCRLISAQPSERAQSVLAEGGINAALDTMGEDDSVEEHFADTMRGGCYLQSDEEVLTLTGAACGVVRELARLGVPFEAKDGQLILRNFGGQKKKRTAYCKSSTGKVLMTALIDEARRYETAGRITRFSHHELVDILPEGGRLAAVLVRDGHTGTVTPFAGPCILCTGGLNGMFPGMTTGTTQNTGNAAAIAFARGVEMKNLEFIQYHPTTVGIPGKRMLISEAARGEGGRLYYLRNGQPWYFMEEKYPSLGNLMPRDVVSREMVLCGEEPGVTGDCMLDMTGLEETVFSGKLSDMREEILQYLDLDIARVPVPVGPGIHYFMGGIRVDARHETNIRGLFAAGEAASRYHGANRLGGNSMLGALVGGRIAALAAAETAEDRETGFAGVTRMDDTDTAYSAAKAEKLGGMLLDGLGILRTEQGLADAADRVQGMLSSDGTRMEHLREQLGLAMLRSAMARKESRGAHWRLDYPTAADCFRADTVISLVNGNMLVRFEERPQGGNGQ